jgi:hypothetical protein
MTPREPLDELLARWNPPPGVMPDLRAEIRRELARARAVDRGTWFSRLDSAFSRPSFAIAFISACVLLGLFLAEARVTQLHARYGAQVARSYVQLIDPLLESQMNAAPATKEAP